MKGSLFNFTAIATIFIISLMAIPANGTDRAKPLGYFGISAGLIGSGPIDAEDDALEYYKTSDLIAGFFLDFPLGHKFLLGISADYLPTRLQYTKYRIEIPDESGKGFDAALAFKLNLSRPGKPLMFRPGFALGYAVINYPYHGIDNCRFFTTKLFLETVVMGGSGTGLILETGLLYSPSGKNDYYKMTAGPMLLFRAGLIFSGRKT